MEKKEDLSPEISVVIPLYNEEGNVNELYNRLTATLEKLGRSYEVLMIDDASTDRTFSLLEKIHHIDQRVKVVQFTRNFGQQAAITAGFRLCRGRYVLTMDADLENHPEEIPLFIEQLDKGAEIVSGARSTSRGNFLRRLQSRIFNYILARFTGAKLRDFGSMFRAYNRQVIEQIITSEGNLILPNIISAWMGFKIVEIDISFEQRKWGRSKYRLSHILRLLFDVFTGYSVSLIRAVSLVGIFISLLGLAFGCYLLIHRILFGVYMGFKVIFAALLILGGFQVMATGLIGEYIARIYLELKKRPFYVIRKILK